MLLILRYLGIDIKDYWDHLRKDILIETWKDLVYNFVQLMIYLLLERFSQSQYPKNNLEINGYFLYMCSWNLLYVLRL